MSNAAAITYHDPAITTILILSSFLLLVNAIGYAFDRLLFCGLVGQVAVGVAWGTPGGDILPSNVQDTIMQLGYLGLILLVYEGGLSTDLRTLKSNLFLSSFVALIGISAPIGISFALRGFMDITPVQAFTAGAALCSTSLGTTFTILSTSGLNQSRLGVVLSSAAMMDDVVGLVMSGIISSLGDSSIFSAITVIRPVFVSVAFAVLVPLVCLLIVRPMTRRGLGAVTNKRGRLSAILGTEHAALTLHTTVLIVFITGASYAGTSNLFAAYLAGAVVSWWDSLCQDIIQEQGSALSSEMIQSQETPEGADQPQTEAEEMQINTTHTNFQDSASTKNPDQGPPPPKEDPQPASRPTTTNRIARFDLRGTHIFHKFCSPALETILKPFFFASIGFAIPITRMFTGSVVWRGIVYTILMIIGKLVCGLCLKRLGSEGFPVRFWGKISRLTLSSCCPWPIRAAQEQPPRPKEASRGAQARQMNILKPKSLYPAALLGSAMVARGEIGFLISSVAGSEGVFGDKSDGQSSELFLVVTWAILLCTLLGPIVVGLMVRRVKRIQEIERSQKTGKEDPLGIWGIIPVA